jgi:hypothetical protein
MSLADRARAAVGGVILAAAAVLVPDPSAPLPADPQAARAAAIARTVIAGVAALGHEPESAPFAHDHFFRAVRRSGLPRRTQEYLIRVARRADDAGRLESSHKLLGHVHRKGQPRRKERAGTGVRTSKRHVRYVPPRARNAEGQRAVPRAPRLAIQGWVLVIPPPVRAEDRIGSIDQTVWQLVIPPQFADQADRDASDIAPARVAPSATPAVVAPAPEYGEQEVTWIRAALAALAKARPAGPWVAPEYLARVIGLGKTARKNGPTVANAVWGLVGFARNAKRTQSDEGLEHRLPEFIRDEYTVSFPTKAPAKKVEARTSTLARAVESETADASPPLPPSPLDPELRSRMLALTGVPVSSLAPAAADASAEPLTSEPAGDDDDEHPPPIDGARGPRPRA